MCSCFLFNDTATTEIYTLSLHDALPICAAAVEGRVDEGPQCARRLQTRERAAPRHPGGLGRPHVPGDRKSTRLNSSHANISDAVFCLKKKNHVSDASPRRVSVADV